MKNIKAKEYKIITETLYKIYQLTLENHLVEPIEYGEHYIFDHYCGYQSMEDARLAIENYANSLDNEFYNHPEYLIIPHIKVSAKEV